VKAIASLLCLTVVCLAVAAPAPRLKPNLLKNGSFEEGRNFNSYIGVSPGGTDVTHWVVTRGGIDIVDRYWKAAHGNRSIDLHGSPGFGGIQQTFKTTPGKSYSVTFSLAVNPDRSFPKKTMGVSAAKQSAEFTFDGTGKTLQDPGWVRKNWKFTATEKETTLELYTLMKNDDACGPIIDDVSVTEDD
jgi:choice-of-anchor C domain-containing protein